MVATSSAGLSPRVRGNHVAPEAALDDARSIPACAGEPAPPPPELYPPPVYPRVCGGTIIARWAPPCLIGLSPRVRGNRAVVLPAKGLERSIPACAGEPGVGSSYHCHPPVYPRVCGGTARRRRTADRDAGLSPRVRGNRPAPPPTPRTRGSIPACAGEPAMIC